MSLAGESNESKKIEVEEDPVILKLAKTGCLEKHYAVLVCVIFL
jgi:hypothetical protein